MCPSIGAYANHALFHSFITSKQPQEICALQLNLSDFSYELNAKMLDTYPDSSISILCIHTKCAKIHSLCHNGREVRNERTF